MTLASVPRYDPDRTPTCGEHAVIAGGGVAGLVTARVLADNFDAVTVVERDPLPDERTARRGVPQGRHVHLLEEAGRSTFEDLFPGFGEELIAEGGVIVDVMSDFKHFEDGDFLADGESRYDAYFASRPLYEHILSGRVAERPEVTVRSGCQFTEFVAGDGGTRVDGIRLRDEEGDVSVLEADMVVDATGRTSRTPSWLEETGFEAPPVDEVSVDLAYSTATIERPSDDRRAFFVPPKPSLPRGVAIFPVEGDRWLVTVFGVHGDHPPTDPDGLTEFARTLPIDEPGRLLEEQPWVTDDVAHYPFPSNRRRRYEDLDRFPEGLLVVGDALTSFNPIYGQGMSVAALEALQLHHALAAEGREDLAHRFFEQAAEVIDIPWSIAVGGDFVFPETSGPKPRGTDLINRYLARLISSAHTDPRLREPLIRVFFLDRPPSSLFHPSVVFRVLKPT